MDAEAAGHLPADEVAPDPVLDDVARAREALAALGDRDPEDQLALLEQVHEQLRQALAAGEAGPDLPAGP